MNRRIMVLAAFGAFVISHAGAQDKTPPTIAKVSSDFSLAAALVEYSETVGDTALVLANYALSNSALNQPVPITAITRINPSVIKLTTGPLAEGALHTLTVNNVRDIAVPANTIAANSRATFLCPVFMKGYLQHNFYETGGAPESLLADPNYPDNPTFRTFEPLAEYPPDGTDGAGSNYRNGLLGWFQPPRTGDYVFFIASDDQGKLYLSTDEDPANIRLIAEETMKSDPRRWTSSALSDLASKRSDQYDLTEWPGGNTIRLEAGKRYFFEVLHSEGGEGDQVGVTFILAGQRDPADLSPPALGGANVGLFLDPTPSSITLTQQPKSQSILVNSSATFSVAVTGFKVGDYPGLIHYQWQKAPAGGEFADIPGASGTAKTSYTTPPLVAADNQSRYRIVATAPGLTVNSEAAIATVVTDNEPPRVVSAMRKFTSDTQVVVVFSELLKASTANTAANYVIDGVTVSAAALAADGKSVLLTFAPGFARGTAKTLNVSAIQDVAGNTIQPTSPIAIAFERGALFIEGNVSALPILPNAASQAVINLLIRKGYAVKILSSTTDAEDGSSAKGMDLIVISSTIGSGNVENSYSSVAIPVINWESNLSDNLGFNNPDGPFVATGASTDIVILKPAHPLSAGFPAGPVAIWKTEMAGRAVDPVPVPDLISVAGAVDDPTQIVYYALDKGAAVYDPDISGVAKVPERRVQLPLGDTAALSLSDNGWKLVEAAIDWAQHVEVATSLPRITSVFAAKATFTVQWTGGGTLQSTPSLTPPVTWKNEAGSDSFSTPVVGPARFFRVMR